MGEFDKILSSPGPGIPSEAGIILEVIERYMETKPILGICLGHQAIAESFGGKLRNLDRVYHGISTPITIVSEDPILNQIPNQFKACRYHSWVAEQDSLPGELLVTSTDDKGIIMSLRHKSLPIHGIQFHPESIMTEHGKQMIKNWIEL